MTVRESLFAAAVAIAFILIATGFAIVAPFAGFIAAGILLAIWSWMVLGGETSGDDR